MVTVKQETKNIKIKNAKLIALAKDPKRGEKTGIKLKEIFLVNAISPTLPSHTIGIKIK